MGSRCGQEGLPPEMEVLVTADCSLGDLRESYFIQYLSSLTYDSIVPLEVDSITSSKIGHI